MEFVKNDSIVRKIWGSTDIILFIFAGAAAEFSLNKAVDWLYFTGKLPKDPLGRLFSTVAYAQKIVFSSLNGAHAAIDQIAMIHKGVENTRNTKIPDWAYRDVLFMLIDYSIRAFELLERKLSLTEKEEIFNTFLYVGKRMEIQGLPADFAAWGLMHQLQLNENLINSIFSKDLYSQYKRHLGEARFYLMLKIQARLVPRQVNTLLNLGNGSFIIPVLALYKLCRFFRVNEFLRNMILPAQYKTLILGLNITNDCHRRTEFTENDK